LATLRRLPAPLVLLSALAHVFGAAFRTVRWLLMLRGGGLRVAWRPAVAASFGSDLLGPLPASPFVASYLLHRTGAASAVSTVPIVLAGLWAEVLVVVAGTAVVSGAAPRVVQLAAVLLCAAALAAAALLHWRRAQALVWRIACAAARVGRRTFGRWRSLERIWAALDGLPSWTPSLARAFGPRTLVPALTLTFVPMLLGTTITALIAAELGYPQLTAPRAWAASGTVLVLALASPLPFDLGVVEGGQMLTYGWIGVPAAAALAITLLGRFWNATIGLTLSALVTWWLRREIT